MIQRDHVLQFCAALSWHPGLHGYDGYRIGLTLGYAVATVLAGLRFGQTRRWVWLIAAGYLLVLTLNKQLDLQSFATQTGRCVARYQGWYGERRTPQADLTYLVLGLMAAGFAASLILIRANRLLFTGLVLITAVLALRILSFHTMDSLLQIKLLTLPLHGFIEAFAVLLIIYAAARQA